MAIDPELAEICEVFFEESTEGLEIMEQGLLGLDLGAADLEIINNIFRAAHSIKGGAGTFGFMEVSGFTHGLETLLDQMRDGQREVTEDAVQLLLESVDCLGGMLGNLQADESDDPAQRNKLTVRIKEMLESTTPPTSGKSDPKSSDSSSATPHVDDSAAVAEKSAELTSKPPATAKPAPQQKKPSSETSSIRVGIDKVDSLLNLVGELVITQSMLKRFGEYYDPTVEGELRDGLAQLERHTRELQESAMQIRMLPINSSFSRFPRLVRDLSNTLGKKIDLVVSGEHTEVDKTVLEKLSDPLVHLVRNSLDHGIEMPETRIANGKQETGTLRLSAAHEGGNVVIKVEDDGAGLNRERIVQKAVEKGLILAGEKLTDERVDNLIFHPGFSTAEQVSDVSGRGVGMDVVRRNIVDLGGKIRVQSFPGKGTSLRISLPLTLAILDGQLVRVGDEVYVISVLSIVETIQVRTEQIKTVSEGDEVFLLRDTYIPVARATDLFGVNTQQLADLLIIVETEDTRFGVLVNELLEQQQIVIKSIEKNYKKVEGITGATILGDGRVALILDIPGLLQNMVNSSALPKIESDVVAVA